MLSSDQIDALRDAAEQLMDPVIEFLIEEIADRVKTAGQLTSTAAYQTWILQTMGMGQKKLKKELSKRLGLTMEEVGRLMKQAAQAGYDFDISRFPTAGAIPFSENGSIQQIVAAAVKLAQDDLTNLTQTMGFVAANGKAMGLTDAYKNCCDFAFEKVVTGAQDYNSAVRQAVKGLAEKGILTIDYESGARISMDAAVRRSVMGGMGLMQEQISQQNHDDLGCDGWEISAHAASAPDHEPIQGKQYTDAEYKKLNESLVRRIGTLNCGHAAFPIILGVNSPQYTPEELEQMRQDNEKGIDYGGRHYTMYKATQRQRSIERGIRKQKRRILVDEKTGDKEKLQTDQIRYQLLDQEYKRFSKATGQKLRYERMEAVGFGPKQARAAEKAVAYQESVKDQAKFRDSVTIIPPFKGDAITHRSLHNNLAKSKVGKETIEFINSGRCSVEVNYTDEAPKGTRGVTIGKNITIYAKNTRTIKMTAKTLVHEVTHCKYGIGGSQWAEAVCFAREHLHESGELTFKDMRNIIKEIKELYPEYQWRKGGRNKWKK